MTMKALAGGPAELDGFGVVTLPPYNPRAAPCHCVSPGGIHTTSPGRISSIGPPHRCARPRPAVTNDVFPGFFLYYPQRAQQPAAITAVIETFRLQR